MTWVTFRESVGGKAAFLVWRRMLAVTKVEIKGGGWFWVGLAAGRWSRTRRGGSRIQRGESRTQVAPAFKAAPAAPTPTSAGKGGRNYSSKLDAHRDVIGKLTDREVAALAGVSRDVVRDYRKRHNIPSEHAAQVAATAEVATGAPTDTAPPSTVADAAQRTRPAKATAKQRRPRVSKLDPFVHLIGKLSDRDVAALAGVTYENVRAYRARRGIARRWVPAGGARKARGAAAPSAGNEAKPTPLAAPAAQVAQVAQVAQAVEVVGEGRVAEAAVEGEVVDAAQVPMGDVAPVARRAAPSQGYKVETRDEAGMVVDFIVVAANVADAAVVAQAAVGMARPGAQITAIRHLGPGLACFRVGLCRPIGISAAAVT